MTDRHVHGGALVMLGLLACRPAMPIRATDSSSQGCIEVATAPGFGTTAVLATDHSLIIGGFDEDTLSAQLLELDEAGAIMWQREFELPSGVAAIVTWQDGYAILVYGFRGSEVLKVSPTGPVSTLAVLTDQGNAPQIQTMLEHDGRLLLAGSRARDLWIGYLGEGGEIETIIEDDCRGFGDSVIQLLASEDELVALARVGTAGTIRDFDLIIPEPSETHVISYSHSGVELGRAILSSEGELSSMAGTAVVRGPSGNLIVVGYRGHVREFVEVRAWAAGIVASEVEWLKWWSGPPLQGREPPLAQLSAAARLGGDVILAGHVQTANGDRRWHVRADPATGEVHEQYIGTELAYVQDSYRAAVGSPTATWLVGERHAAESVSQWICRLSGTDSG